MVDYDPPGGWKQQTYPWSSNAPRSADDVDGRPARSHFWVIPALAVGLVVVLILLTIFAPSDDPPVGQADVIASATPVAPLLVV